MIGELFLDSSIKAIINIPNDYEKNRLIFESLSYTLEWYKNEIENDDIEIEFAEKVNLVSYLNNYRLKHENYTYEKLKETLLNGKYNHFVDSLDHKRIKYSYDDCDEFLQYILKKKKLCQLLTGRIALKTILNNIETGNYQDEEEIIEEWNERLHNLYLNMMDTQKEELLEEVSQLDLLNDDYTPVVQKISETLNVENSIKTGFNFLDRNLSTDGLEQRRLYLIGGTSGVGKSNFLINLVKNAITYGKGNQTFLYITAENLIDESLIRMYCCITGNSFYNVVNKIKREGTYDFKTEIKNEFQKHNSNVIFYYVQGSTTRVKEIELLVDSIKNKYKNLAGVYIDYLDLLRPNRTQGDRRLDLGVVADELKNIAINFAVPMTTVTQLNRLGYEKDLRPSLTQMSESMLKIDRSDVVLFLQSPKDNVLKDSSVGKEYKIIRLSLLKNRNGPTDDFCHLRVLDKLSNTNVFNYRFEEFNEDEFNNLENDEEDINDMYSSSSGIW